MNTKALQPKQKDGIRYGIFKKELRHSAQLVERSNKEFMQLTFTAAHDLQEPLRTQANYLELLKESLNAKDYDDLLRFVNKTESAAVRMSHFVSDLLSYSRLGASNEREFVNLSNVMEEIREELETKLSETKTKLSIGELPTIRGDSSKVKQLLLNLCTNAIKYVKPGVVPEVSVFTEKNGIFWTLNVKDNGIGIDPHFHSQIFVMFKRLHGKTDYDGTGIGLTICAKVAESMGAEIGVTSAPERGSTFWVRFHNSSIQHNS